MNDVIRNAGRSFVDQVGPRAQTQSLDKAAVQAEYRAMAHLFSPEAQQQLADYMLERFADAENRWLYAVLEMTTPPAGAQVSPAVKRALDAVDGAPGLSSADRAKLKSLITEGSANRDVDVRVDTGPGGALAVSIGNRREVAMMFHGKASKISSTLGGASKTFAAAANDTTRWDRESSYVKNRLSLGFDALLSGGSGKHGLRGYEAAIAATDAVTSHLDDAKLQTTLRIDVPGAKGQLVDGGRIAKIRDTPHSNRNEPVRAMVTTTIGWETAVNMTAGLSQDVFYKDKVDSVAFEAGAGMAGVFQWQN